MRLVTYHNFQILWVLQIEPFLAIKKVCNLYAHHNNLHLGHKSYLKCSLGNIIFVAPVFLPLILV